MNNLKVPVIAHIANANAIIPAFGQNGVAWHAIGQVCWPKEYPYKPDAEFAIAHDDEAIYIAYRVKENCVRALALDGGEVWKDSCCELFIAPDEQGYYNIECNCAGHPLVAFGPDRNHRTPAALSTIALIDRFTSLGNEPFGLRNGDFSWQMALKIPRAVFFKHHGLRLNGDMRANVYKCGDETIAHFLAWNKVGTPKPDFHQPAYFGTFNL